MGDHLKKAQAGQPLEIPAATFNTFIDAARAHLGRQRSTGMGTDRSARDPDVVLVRNDSGYDLTRFEVLGVSGVVISPADNLDEFKNAIVLTGTTPSLADHFGRFVVLLEPLAADEIGRACASGMCQVKVNVVDEDDAYADVRDGSRGTLESTDRGASYIYWRQSGTGEKWAVVKLSIPAPECLCSCSSASESCNLCGSFSLSCSCSASGSSCSCEGLP